MYRLGLDQDQDQDRDRNKQLKLLYPVNGKNVYRELTHMFLLSNNVLSSQRHEYQTL